ncbi:MAG: TatD family hydrolase [Victivallaceae bacterium]|nr:TatD family hydrolase [Victivallaceae bacterium]
MIELFDTHFHYDGAQTPLEFCAALPPGYNYKLMAVAADLEDSFRVRGFAEAVDFAWFACGIHPHEAANGRLDAADFNEFLRHPKLRAIGEIGLDYFYDFTPRDRQLETFAFFLDLALAGSLPAIIHLRDRDGAFSAYEDALTLLKPFAASGGRFVIHCFSATPEWAEKFLELGAYLGVTGMVTFKRSDNIRAALAAIPDDRLLLETDSPYLAPVPFRGNPNHPAHLVEIAAYAAEQKNMTTAEIGRLTTENGRSFFKI